MSLEAMVGVGLSSLVLVLWADDWWNVRREWRTFRDPRSFRTFLKSTLIVAGALAFLLGALYVYVWPDSDLTRDLSRAWGWAVRAGLLIIGAVIFITRLRD